MRGDAHVRFGRRAGETDQPKGRYRASARPHRVLQAGATRRLFDGVRAASTVGIWLRAFAWAAVRQLDRVTRQLLARAWQAGLGPPDLAADLTIDIDSTVCETYGLKKQGGTGFAYYDGAHATTGPP